MMPIRPMTADEQALAEECLRFVEPAIRALCMACPGIRCKVEAIDAVSIGQLAVCRAAQTYDAEKSKPTTYFSRAVRNAILKELGRKRRFATDGPERVPFEAVEVLLHRQPEQDVAIAISALPESAVRLIRRRYYDGETLTDMARQDGCTRSTIRRRLSRALALVRSALETQPDEP